MLPNAVHKKERGARSSESSLSTAPMSIRGNAKPAIEDLQSEIRNLTFPSASACFAGAALLTRKASREAALLRSQLFAPAHAAALGLLEV